MHGELSADYLLIMNTDQTTISVRVLGLVRPESTMIENTRDVQNHANASSKHVDYDALRKTSAPTRDTRRPFAPGLCFVLTCKSGTQKVPQHPRQAVISHTDINVKAISRNSESRERLRPQKQLVYKVVTNGQYDEGRFNARTCRRVYTFSELSGATYI